jgi:hypothetical protein
MATFDGSLLYNRATMPKVEKSIANGCDFVRFYWVCTKDEQQKVDAHWSPEFYRHSLIDAKMVLDALPGAGVPGWDDFGYKIAHGILKPTGLAHDPRLVPNQVPGDKRVWHHWELEEIGKEVARCERIEAAWAYSDANYKAINPTWGGGT